MIPEPTGGIESVFTTMFIGYLGCFIIISIMINAITQKIKGTITLLTLFFKKVIIVSFFVISNAPLTQTNNGTLMSLKQFKNME